jgi:6-pyruvoyltetrahydropterin/6-carboxytetrahydropterin synthase
MAERPIVAITRVLTFAAAHRLYNPEWDNERNDAMYGKCNNFYGHGHDYEVWVTLRGPADPETGMIINLNQVDRITRAEIVEKCDHKHLNHDVDFLRGLIPTTENLAVAFWRRLEPHFGDLLEEVKVAENPRNWCVYRGDKEGS